MATNPYASFPSQTVAPTGAYPYGAAKNVSAPGAGDGTPWTALLVNDIFGLLQSLLAATGTTPSGGADEVGDSQYLDSLIALFDQSAAGTTSVAGLLQLSDDPTSNSTARAATINAVKQVRDMVNALAVVSGSPSGTNWSVKIGKLKLQGGSGSINGNTTTTITFSGTQSAYTSVHVAFIPWITVPGPDRQALKGTVVNLSSGSINNSDAGNSTYGYLSIGFDL